MSTITAIAIGAVCSAVAATSVSLVSTVSLSDLAYHQGLVFVQFRPKSIGELFEIFPNGKISDDVCGFDFSEHATKPEVELGKYVIVNEFGRWLPKLFAQLGASIDASGEMPRSLSSVPYSYEINATRTSVNKSVIVDALHVYRQSTPICDKYIEKKVAEGVCVKFVIRIYDFSDGLGNEASAVEFSDRCLVSASGTEVVDPQKSITPTPVIFIRSYIGAISLEPFGPKGRPS